VSFVFGYLTWPHCQDPFFIFTIVMFKGGVGDTGQCFMETCTRDLAKTCTNKAYQEKEERYTMKNEN
jgi:hypothetical protein